MTVTLEALEREFMTLAEAAERYGYTDASSLRQAVHRGSLKAVKIGNTYLTKPDWVEDYIKSRPRGPAWHSGVKIPE